MFNIFQSSIEERIFKVIWPQMPRDAAWPQMSRGADRKAFSRVQAVTAIPNLAVAISIVYSGREESDARRIILEVERRMFSAIKSIEYTYQVQEVLKLPEEQALWENWAETPAKNGNSNLNTILRTVYEKRLSEYQRDIRRGIALAVSGEFSACGSFVFIQEGTDPNVEAQS
jgi:hypothetical protein